MFFIHLCLNLINELRKLKRHKMQLATSTLKVMDRHTDYLGLETFQNTILQTLPLTCILYLCFRTLLVTMALVDDGLGVEARQDLAAVIALLIF